MTAQITVSTSDGRSFVRPVDRDEFAVGRDSRNHLVLGDRQVSKFHCQICRQGEEYLVKDLNSSNGTLINGIRVDGEVSITTGDRIRVGPYELIFAGTEADSGYLRPSQASPVPEAFQPGGTAAPEAVDVSDLLDPMGAGPGAGDAPKGSVGAPSATDPSLGQARSIQLRDPAAPPSATSSDRWVSDSGLTPREGVAYLEIVEGDGKGHMITIGSRGVTVGAGSRNNLVLDDPFVSRQHCRVDPANGRFAVKDLGSTNGIRVDGQDVAEAELEDGTRLQVGGVLMVFRRPGHAAVTSGSAPAQRYTDPTPTGKPSAPGAPPLSQGPPQRSGRSTATVPQMNALPAQSSKDSLRPLPPPVASEPTTARGSSRGAAATRGQAVSAARGKPAPGGVVRIGSLRFKKWQVAFLGGVTALLVLALLYQAAGYMFDLDFGGSGEPDVNMYDLGLQAYRGGEWDTAEAYLSKVGADDPNAAEAAKYLQNIRLERENAERSERVAMLMQEYGYSQDPGFFERSYAVFQEISPKSRYYEDARALVEPVVPVEAARLVEEAAQALEDDKDLEGATALLDRAEAYDGEVDGIEELRAVIEAGPRRLRRNMKEYRENQARPDDEEGDDADTGGGPAETTQVTRPPTSGGSAATGAATVAADAAAATYLGGDVDGARAALERAIDTTSDPAQKLELQDVLGRIDRIERSRSSGLKAMDGGDLDKALDRLENAYRDINRLDTSGQSTRRSDLRKDLAECRYRRGRAAFDDHKYAKANFEWSSGNKAWSGHAGIGKGRRELEEVAKGTYNEAYLAEREGTEKSVAEARKLYEQVMAIAPQGSGFEYYDKASARLSEL